MERKTRTAFTVCGRRNTLYSYIMNNIFFLARQRTQDNGIHIGVCMLCTLVAIEFKAIYENNIITHSIFILYVCTDVQISCVLPKFAINAIKQTQTMTPNTF